MNLNDDPQGDTGPRTRRTEQRILWLGLIVVAALAVASFAVGGVFSRVALAGVEAMPVAVLAVFAHLGRDRYWARVLAWLWGGHLLLFVFLFGLGGQVGENPHDPPPEFIRAFGVSMLACLGVVPLLSARLRGRIGRAIGLRIDTPAAHLGLFLTVALSLLMFAPLLERGVQFCSIS